jgi:mannose-1-phosphate guanylyltransferase
LLYYLVMIVVIIAGGSGSRLWPLSTPDYPKHLLKVNGSDSSLLQATYKRASQLADHIYVVSESSHIDHVRQQLPDLPPQGFIVEPARRGTANCIVAALGRISDQHGEDEPVAFIHADHYIRDTAGFVGSLQAAAEISQAQGRIVLVGIEPDYPATCFGYIQKGKPFKGTTLAYNVSSFKEKPDFDTAKQYLESGEYLWNAGYFVGSVGTFRQKMQAYAPDLLVTYEKLAAAGPDGYEAAYLELKSQAIDYALIEKVKDLLVVQASFDWMDLGSFGDLHKAIGGDEQGNHVHGRVEIEEVDNSFVQNYEEKPLVVLGLDNVVVVNTPKGLLVARKDLSQKVGDVSKRFNES